MAPVTCNRQRYAVPSAIKKRGQLANCPQMAREEGNPEWTLEAERPFNEQKQNAF